MLDADLREILFKYCQIIEIEFKTTTANVVSDEVGTLSEALKCLHSMIDQRDAGPNKK